MLVWKPGQEMPKVGVQASAQPGSLHIKSE